MNDLIELYEKSGGINEEEQNTIVTAGVGQAFLITSATSRTQVQIEAYDYVKQLFTSMAIISGALAIGMIFGMAACTPKDPTPEPTPPTPPVVQVEAVENIWVNDTIISWDSATGAIAYNVKIDDEVLTITPISETSYNAEGIFEDGKDYNIGVQSVGEEGETAAYKYIDYTYQAEQEAQKPAAVQNISVNDTIIKWDASANATGYNVKINNNVVTSSPLSKDVTEFDAKDFLATGDNTIAVQALGEKENAPYTEIVYNYQQQQEQNYKEQIDANLNTKINSFLASRLYKNIQNVEVKKVDIRDNTDTAKSEMLLWFNADVSKGVNNWNRDFIYKIQLGKQYDLTNNETNQKAIADATDELASIPNTAFEEILNNESINENVVETLFGLQNCDSTLKALQGKTIEMETITSGRIPGNEIGIVFIVEGKVYSTFIRNTTWNANSNFAETIAAIKAGGSNISTSTREIEAFSKNSNVYDTMKAVIREAKVEQARMIADILFIKHVLSKDTGMSF